jgi:hypothetical protein
MLDIVRRLKRGEPHTDPEQAETKDLEESCKMGQSTLLVIAQWHDIRSFRLFLPTSSVG